MVLRLLPAVALVFVVTSLFGQERFTAKRNLRAEWLSFEEGTYKPVGDKPVTRLNTIYFQLDPQSDAGDYLSVKSSKPYFIFVNGKVSGEFVGWSKFRIDSMLQRERRASWVAIHQDGVNERDLVTEVISRRRPALEQEDLTKIPRPYSHFRDFVVLAGLLIILLFLLAFRANPKLASDYFAAARIFTSREMDESQASVRLTGGSNVQFYVLCSLLIGYYLLIILQHLPAEYAVPVRFQVSGFWTMWWQWLKLSVIVFFVLVAKVFLIFVLTRLFDMRGMARFHFFNWIRLLLVTLGAATIILFMYFISRGDDAGYYVAFLSVVVAVLVAWIVVAFFKLSGRTGHSLFHLFSYLCATEIIPLIITVKVLFQ